MEDQLFETIYDRTARPLWAYIARMSGDIASADDILQETYLRFINARRRPTDGEEVRRYLFKIATNLVYDRFRGRALRRETELDDAVESAVTEFASAVELNEVFARLRKQDRALLWLAYVEGYDHAQIAKIVNANRLSIKVLLFRARRKLVELIEEKK